MKVCEIFTSVQGESTYAGLPCVFIRMSGCNLRCSYCDTKYAYSESKDMSINEVKDRIAETGLDLVEITGGEPLLQRGEVVDLTLNLLDAGHKVLIETNGALSIRNLDNRVTVILDVKTPGSGMTDKMDFSNFEYIKSTDEIKFVICNRNDHEWAKKIISSYKLIDKCSILFSPAFGVLAPLFLARWIIEDRLNVRLNLQIHKYVFDPNGRMV